ncbi:50S ribosomal protein L5 [Candidatus Woesearchaeota archaeon CG10_big_fil_rev_8_21_14_0_10_44_13]|nr:MAG: 50S ribosomal protein L5 [Candidatus Woesearchaeota archaeon CG10_big_fil_rev_8_21_14_0_10_44_13]
MKGKTNAMREIRVEKITLNIGTGKDQSKLEKGLKLITAIAGVKPIKTFTQKRIPEWGLRPGLPVGCKATIRGEKALTIISRILDAKSFTLNDSNFDESGTVSIGIPEYTDIRDAKYDPEIGVMGLQICITLERPGFRIKKRRVYKSKIPKAHRITKAEAIEFMKTKFNIKMGEEE